jgi:glyoxylase-like metal-dependent hydrolase (beta-lactamase superfamily II)
LVYLKTLCNALIFPTYEEMPVSLLESGQPCLLSEPLVPEGEPAVRYEDILRDSKKRVEASNKLAARALKLQMLGIGHAARPAVADAADSAPPRAARCFAGPDEPHLVMLGTGAAAPSKLRSCSGILVQLACGVPWGQARGGRALVLLDCGEGCLGRLMTLARLYAPADAALGSSGGGAGAGSRCGAWHGLLLRLAALFVSHMHADHHSGLPALLAHLAAASRCPHCAPRAPRRAPLAVIGPAALEPVLAAYAGLLGHAHGGPSEPLVAFELAGRAGRGEGRVRAGGLDVGWRTVRAADWDWDRDSGIAVGIPVGIAIG